MDSCPHPSSSSSDRDEPLTPDGILNESTAHHDLTPKQPSMKGSELDSSGRIRRWSEPQDDCVPMSPMFKPSHRRYVSMPINARHRNDPRSASVYKWLDSIAEAGGAEPLETVPFHPPPDLKPSSLRVRLPVPQPRIDMEHWEDAIEEEDTETPTEVVDPQAVNLGISMSDDTAVTDEELDSFVLADGVEANKDAPFKKG